MWQTAVYDLPHIAKEGVTRSAAGSLRYRPGKSDGGDYSTHTLKQMLYTDSRLADITRYSFGHRCFTSFKNF